MAISILLKIGGVTIPKIKKYTVSRNKLWADAGRNMKGGLKATFIGIFIKIKLEFGMQNPVEMSQLIEKLDQSFFTVQWWDEKQDELKSGTFYASDYDVELFKKDTGFYEGFTVNLIATKKLS